MVEDSFNPKVTISNVTDNLLNENVKKMLIMIQIVFNPFILFAEVNLRFSCVQCLRHVLCISGALDMISAFTMAFGGIYASAILHLDLLNNILHGPLIFFEQTPMGRILNRFTNDMATIDFVMPFTIRSIINCVLQMTGTLCVIGATTPMCLASVPPLVLLYYIVQVLHLKP